MTALAVVGAGRMARRHVEAYLALPTPPTIAYVVSPRRAGALAAPIGAVAIDVLQRALEDPAIRLVDICTPPATHRELAVASLEAGKHVIIEKPLALDPRDATAIIEAEQKSAGFAMVAHVVRFIPAYKTVEACVAEGHIGVPSAVRARRVSPHPRDAAWIDDEDASGGAVVDLMVHDFDQANAYLGSPRRVFARRGSLHAPIEVTVEYDAGAASVEGSWWMPDSYPFSSSIEVHGDRGVVTATADPDVSVDLYPSDGPARELAVAGLGGYEAQAAYVLGCVESESAPRIGTAAQSLAALDVALAARRSLATGRVEQVSRH